MSCGATDNYGLYDVAVAEFWKQRVNKERHRVERHQWELEPVEDTSRLPSKRGWRRSAVPVCDVRQRGPEVQAHNLQHTSLRGLLDEANQLCTATQSTRRRADATSARWRDHGKVLRPDKAPEPTTHFNPWKPESTTAAHFGPPGRGSPQGKSLCCLPSENHEARGWDAPQPTQYHNPAVPPMQFWTRRGRTPTHESLAGDPSLPVHHEASLLLCEASNKRRSAEILLGMNRFQEADKRLEQSRTLHSAALRLGEAGAVTAESWGNSRIPHVNVSTAPLGHPGKSPSRRSHSVMGHTAAWGTPLQSTADVELSHRRNMLCTPAQIELRAKSSMNKGIHIPP